jgi:hypothetical protein
MNFENELVEEKEIIEVEDPKYDIDDSWIENDDKKILLNHLKELYTMQFPWAADYLIKNMVLYHYKNTVKKMSEPEEKKQYLKEKEEQKNKETKSLNIDEFLKD